LQPERLEDRMMLSANPFHNGFWPEDVNNDLRVDPMDALIVINAMNQYGSRELLNSAEPLPDMADVPHYTDVSGDGALTAIDALRVVNTVNSGEGEIAPSDVVRYRLALTDINGNSIASNSVSVGQTFQVRGYVQDVRLQGGSTAFGNPTGVFAAYMDVLMTNANLATIRYGETQELRLDATRPADVLGTGSFRLTFQGQQTAAISYLGSRTQDTAAIKAALEALPAIGPGNVEVTTLQGADFDGRYFIRFVRALGEQNIPGMTVVGTGLIGSGFTPAPQVVDNYIPINPATPELQAALFRSSFTFYDPYLNGPSALQEAPEDGQASSSQFGEVGAFLNRFSLSDPRFEYPFFSVDVRADQGGIVQFSGNVAETNKTLVFGITGGGGSNTEVNPANIGFIDPAPLAILAPITVVNDTRTVLEDSGTTSITVLSNDSVNTAAGGVAPLSLVAGGLSAVNPAGSATVSISGNSVNFTPAADFNGQVTFTYQARDAKTPTPNTATGTVTVNVTAVNDLPTLDTIANRTINEDAGQQTVNLTGISAGGGETQPLQVTATSSNTTLIPNVTVGYTSPDTTGLLTFTTPQNLNGSAVVTVTVTDGGLDGNLATTGDNATFSRSFTVTVNPVNDPPVNTVPAAQTVIEAELLSFTPAISVTDVEAVAEGKPVQVNLGVLNGKLNLGTTANLTNVTGLNTGTLSFQGLVPAVNAALNSLTYQGNTFPQNDTLTITTSDLGASPAPALTDTDTVAIAVVPGSKPSAVSDAFAVDEGSGAHTFDVLVNDINLAGVLGGGNLTITNVTQASAGGVVVNNGTNITYTRDGNFFGTETFTYTAADSQNPEAGDGPSTTTVFVTVNPINDSPVITMAPQSVSTLEDTSFTFSGANRLQFDDVDADAAPTNPGVLVTLSVSHGTLTPGSTANVVVGTTPAGTLTITGLVANVNNALNNTTYTPAQNWDQGDVLVFTVDDRGNFGGGSAPQIATATVTINITAVNDPPVITAPQQAATRQDVNLTFARGTATEISVVDVDSPQVTVGLTLADGATNPGILIAGTPAGVTVVGNNSATVTITGSVAGVNDALMALVYDPVAGYEGSPTLTITATDGENAAPNKVVQVIVSGINDPPVNILPQGPVVVAEDTDLFFNGNLQVSDPDAGLAAVEVTLTATNGTLTPVANAGVTVTVLSPGSIRFVGSIPNINAALNGLKYRPSQDYNGPAQLVISTNDKGNTGDPPASGLTELIDTDTLAITVTPVNDPPVANNDGSPTNRFTVLWNTNNNPFNVLANDNTGPDAGETLTITAANTANGTVVIQNGNLLAYTPTPGFTGNVEIVYTINDRPDGSGLTATATVYLVVVDFVPSDVSGYVYFDADNDGVKDAGEWGIGGVRLTLTGTNVEGNFVNLAAWTDATGLYKFSNVLPSQTGTAYTLSQHQPAAFIDGKDTLGDQGGTMLANDQMRLVLPLFGHAAGVLGVNNNFGEMGFSSQFAGMGLYDLVHSGSTDGGLLFGSDAFGNLLWYVDLGGWNEYVPGRESPTNSNNYQVVIQDGKLPLTDTRTSTVREINATDDAIRSMYKSGAWMTRILGDADDFGLPMYPLAAAAEGESLSEESAAELLASVGDAGTYEAAVDAVLAGVV
jgi:hypothetical protein